jgi:histidyl-tRNA synthetase
MANQKPGIPKGTRDFGPTEMAKRTLIFDTIKQVFLKHGYAQIETPAMENLSTLLGKYGEEGDKLIFKVLNSGDFMQETHAKEMQEMTPATAAMKICEKGLRYDLTVPFARFVVQHREELKFPFKRFQIQPVWRADRPQKGRYREFYQCDADIIGSGSLLNEVNLIAIVDEVFRKLGIRICIKLNNRKILAGLSEHIGYPDRLIDITVAIDKFEKAGPENVIHELLDKGFENAAVQELMKFMELSASHPQKKIELLQSAISASPTGKKGLEELSKLLEYCESLNLDAQVEFDLTLARGLNYYTGAIIEVKARDVEMGSICGGGRYDDLTGIFGLKDVSGVGISFGADRIYDVMNQLQSFPLTHQASNGVMFANFGEEEALASLSLIASLHEKDIRAELYPDAVKLARQLDYASTRHIKFFVMMGETEILEGTATIKDLTTGTQWKVSAMDLPLALADYPQHT